MVDSKVRQKKSEHCAARQVVDDYKVDQVRLSLIYADDFKELGDNYKRKLRESRKERSDYKRFCKEHSLFFAKDENVGQRVKRSMPRSRNFSYDRPVDISMLAQRL